MSSSSKLGAAEPRVRGPGRATSLTLQAARNAVCGPRTMRATAGVQLHLKHSIGSTRRVLFLPPFPALGRTKPDYIPRCKAWYDRQN